MYRFSILAVSLIAATSAHAADALQPLATETVVTPRVSGYGELYLGGLRFVDDDHTNRVGGGAVRVNIPFAQRWNLQGDLTYDRIWGHYSPLDGTSGTIHGYYRDPDRFAAGLFAAYTSFGESGVTVNNHAVGPEAQLYFGKLTLYGQASVGQLTINDFHGDQWGLRAVARYFVRKNLRLDAELDFNRTDYDGTNEDVVGAAVQAMYRFDETPWSVFGRYEFERRKFETSTQDTRANKVVIGLRASFGSDSLFDEDRNGTTMDTYRPASVINTK
ncbi:outer membrane beta-barrel protein [Mesorhizobium sp. BH1-1-4]|uniref:outer membrane beta-barrel protein n=1 Tax=Mesorhizobium sp. BH1-1-4 TaxID=2876662 RepID=UPI001CD15F15|nr:outer membrane beta-barrel protein [Mesorhizobium sp. BH1-1-4]MBZ9994354.1 outer membrane beta-barrel protein [Mesorhizobium sp. BH1-1-4]